MIGPVECQSVESMRDLFDTNFFGLARLVKEVLPDMKRRQSGHIVVMSSVMGIQGGSARRRYHLTVNSHVTKQSVREWDGLTGLPVLIFTAFLTRV